MTQGRPRFEKQSPNGCGWATRVNNVFSVEVVVQMAMFLILDITRAHA
jgi:hypothetical protein